MKTVKSKSLEETAKVAKEWLAELAERYSDRDSAIVVGLSGHLGAGKTAFTKIIAKELGIAETITSPTFVIMKIYKTENKVFPRLIHIDAYRLERQEELEVIHWEALVADKNNLIMIEWPKNVGLKDFLPLAHLHFEIKDGAYTIAL
jgi:tRNA threonylcarbamoyladenosine biosynthesis protein TsaE